MRAKDALAIYKKADDIAKFELHDAMANKIDSLVENLPPDERAEAAGKVRDLLDKYNPHSTEGYVPSPDQPEVAGANTPQ